MPSENTFMNTNVNTNNNQNEEVMSEKSFMVCSNTRKHVACVRLRDPYDVVQRSYEMAMAFIDNDVCGDTISLTAVPGLKEFMDTAVPGMVFDVKLFSEKKSGSVICVL